MRAVFIPDRSRKQFSTRKVGTRREAEQDAPYWACRFARVSGGFMVFDSQAALDEWLARADHGKDTSRYDLHHQTEWT